MTQPSRTTALVLTTLLLTTSLLAALPTAVANHNVAVTSPAGGTIVQRGVANWYNATAAMGSSPATCTGVTYTWNIGGAIVTGPSVSYAFPIGSAAGTKTVTVTATYTGASHCGNDKTSSISVVLQNVAPTTDLVLPASATAGDVILADASGSADIDGTVTSWVFTVGGVERPPQASPQLYTSFSSAATHIVSVYAVDSDGAAGATVTRSVDIAAGPLASIAVSGPASVVAGASATYTLSGYDAYGNDVPLAQTALVHTAGTTLGYETVSHTEGGVTGSLQVQIVPDALARIAIEGPGTVVVGETVEYDLSGEDRFGNPVPLARTALLYTAPTLVGVDAVTYEEADITGTLAVTLVHDVVATVVVRTNEPAANLGRSVQARAAAFDRYGNPVPEAVFSWSATRGDIDETGLFTATSEGDASIVATADGVTGEAIVLVTSGLRVTIETTQASYAQLEAAGGVPGSGVVTYVDGGPVAGVTVLLTFTRGEGVLPPETIAVVTDENGAYAFEAPAGARLAGDHAVLAAVATGGNTGEATATYAVAPLPGAPAPGL